MSDTPAPRTSRTALLTAAYRGRATKRPDAICSDAWAGLLAGDDGAELATKYDVVYPAAELFTAVRTAFIDTETKRAIGEGVTQVVLLGAGLDTRAARLSAPGVRFFEVDQPGSQADKLRRIDQVSGYPKQNASYVRCNFETDDFIDQLRAAGFAPDRAAFIIWEGVTPYLTEAAVRATLKRISSGCAAATEVVFDYFSKNLVERKSEAKMDKEILAWLEDLGEPFLFGLNDAIPFLYEEGFRRVRTTSFHEACLNLTGTYDRDRQFRFQHMAVAGRGPLAPR